MTPLVRVQIREQAGLAITGAVVGSQLFGVHPVTALACTTLSSLASAILFSGHHCEINNQVCYCSSCDIGRDVFLIDHEKTRTSLIRGLLAFGVTLSTHLALRALGLNAFASAGHALWFILSARSVAKIVSGILSSPLLTAIASGVVSGALLGWTFSILTPAMCAGIALLGAVTIIAAWQFRLIVCNYWTPAWRQRLVEVPVVAAGIFACGKVFAIPMTHAAMLVMLPFAIGFGCGEGSSALGEWFEGRDRGRSAQEGERRRSVEQAHQERDRARRAEEALARLQQAVAQNGQGPEGAPPPAARIHLPYPAGDIAPA